PTWSGIASYPTGIMDNGADIIDGKVYSVGGVDSSFNTTAHGYVYDPNTDSWAPIADMPAPREKPGVAAVDGKLYVSGGWEPNGRHAARPVGIRRRRAQRAARPERRRDRRVQHRDQPGRRLRSGVGQLVRHPQRPVPGLPSRWLVWLLQDWRLVRRLLTGSR